MFIYAVTYVCLVPEPAGGCGGGGEEGGPAGRHRPPLPSDGQHQEGRQGKPIE